MKHLYVYPEKCTGCRECSIACSLTKFGECNPKKAAINIVRDEFNRYEFPIVCFQCEDPVCLKFCHQNAYKIEDGVVIRDEDKCIGCRLCAVLWPNAIEQGRIAGLNMTGKPTMYDGAEMVNVLDVFETPVVAMGYTSQTIGRCKEISRFTPHSFKKVLLKNNRIVGLQFIGTIRNAGTFYSLMKKGSDVSSVEERLLDDNFVIAPDVLSPQLS